MCMVLINFLFNYTCKIPNILGNAFGGFIMREAFELGFYYNIDTFFQKIIIYKN